jgi:hypothetical protein
MEANMNSKTTTVGHGTGNIPNDGTGMLSTAVQLHPSRLTINPGVVGLDPWLEPFKDSLRSRYSKAEKWIKTINETEGGLEKFSRVSGSKPSSHLMWSDWSARDMKSLASMCCPTMTLSIENGHPLL